MAKTKDAAAARPLSRRALLHAAFVLGAALAPRRSLAAIADLSGSLPPLDFTMTRASDGRTVTATDYRGEAVLLYFGYTFCPDVCPATLLALTTVMKRLGPAAQRVRVLFVTVDPERDTLALLKPYVESFAPQTDALRGTPDQLAALAKRYRVAYSVKPVDGGKSFEVTHGTAVYGFDSDGRFRLLLSGLGDGTADLDQVTAAVRRLAAPGGQISWWRRILDWL